MEITLEFSNVSLDDLEKIAVALKGAGIEITSEDGEEFEEELPQKPAKVRPLRAVESEIGDTSGEPEIGVEVEADGRFIAEVVGVPGALAYGNTADDAVDAAKKIAEEVSNVHEDVVAVVGNSDSKPARQSELDSKGGPDQLVLSAPSVVPDVAKTLDEIQAEVDELEDKQAALDYLQAVRNGGSVEDVATRHTATIKKVIMSEVRQQTPVDNSDERERKAIYIELSTLTGSSVDEIEDSLSDYDIESLRDELQSQRESAGVEEPAPEDDVVDAVYVDNTKQPKAVTEDDIFAVDSLNAVITAAYKVYGDVDEVIRVIKANMDRVTQLGMLRGRPETVVDNFLKNNVSRQVASLK